MATTTATATTADMHTRKRRRISPGIVAPSHPLNVKPAGNALFASQPSNRSAVLGRLAALNDELLVDIISRLGPQELARLSAVSSGCRAFANHEAIWRNLCLELCPTGIETWRGSWKQTTGAHLSKREVAPLAQVRPSQSFYSDVLYLPHRLSFTPIDDEGDSSRVKQMERVPATISTHDFHTKYASQHRPCVLEAPSEGIAGLGMTIEGLKERYADRWIRAEAVRTRVSTYADYAACCTKQQRAMRGQDEDDEAAGSKQPRWYDPATVPDESPYYLFDSSIPTQLDADNLWTVPSQLLSCPPSAYPRAPQSSTSSSSAQRTNADLFSLLSNRRPDHRWLIAGPARSGSGWHKDPNYTSAWNTPLSGHKRWLMLPPDTPPPGVYVTDDGAEVTAPLSLVEWFAGFYDETVKLHGKRKGGDGKLLECVCGPGETVYVPSGWWHLVVNVDESVALTQNFLSLAELPDVLEFMRNRPEQISGFKAASTAVVKEGDEEEEGGGDEDHDDALSDEGKAKLCGEFVAALEAYDGELAKWALQGADELEKQRKAAVVERTATAALVQPAGNTAHANGSSSSWWQRLKAGGDGEQQEGGSEAAAPSAGNGGFSLGGLLGDDGGEELDDVPW